MRVASRLLVIAASIACCSVTSANTFCQGTVDAVTVSPYGIVTVNSAGLSWVYLCAVNGSENAVSADTCKSIVAVLLSAKATGASVQWAFTDDVPCNQRPAWAWLQNWYWGPVLM